MKKKIVYFLPDNPIGDKAGNTTRCFQLLSYFEKNKEVLTVDFVSFLPWNDASIVLFKEFFPDFNLTLIPKKGPKKTNYLKYFFVDKLPKIWQAIFRGKASINLVTPYIEKQVRKQLANNTYDIALISYASWADLIQLIDARYSIVDTHDFITKQFIDRDKKDSHHKIGQLFQQEIDLLKEFNEVWSYSLEEHYIFEQFLKNQVRLMPVSFKMQELDPGRQINYEVLYVASDNPHNIKSIHWFSQQVLPHLHDVKITVIGKICKEIPAQESIEKLGVVEELDAYYQQAKITICPMLSGTGIKIKVLESLSYGIPVVTTRRGVDGLINKTNNGCLVSNDPIEFALLVEKLLNDPEFYANKSLEAKTFFSENYSATSELKLLNTIFLDN